MRLRDAAEALSTLAAMAIGLAIALVLLRILVWLVIAGVRKVAAGRQPETRRGDSLRVSNTTRRHVTARR
ncbi:MAG TPA: hypothetical protein VET65_05665 [Candidatus Limnocylindrales bacterium]|nr:hypothetical protein [Candidatus Limnocylindrales bacterium]